MSENKKTPREFWIQRLNKNTGFISEQRFRSATISEAGTEEHDVLHVIEKSAYDQAIKLHNTAVEITDAVVAERDELQAQLEQAESRYDDIALMNQYHIKETEEMHAQCEKLAAALKVDVEYYEAKPHKALEVVYKNAQALAEYENFAGSTKSNENLKKEKP